ncbi:unnamed protein product [Arctogadus glacialis]
MPARITGLLYRIPNSPDGSSDGRTVGHPDPEDLGLLKKTRLYCVSFWLEDNLLTNIRLTFSSIFVAAVLLRFSLFHHHQLTLCRCRRGRCAGRSH